MNVDADIDQPNFKSNASAPKLNAGINGPDTNIHGPNVDLKGPRTDLTLPDMDMRSGQIKMPAFKMPDIGFSAPKVKTPAYDLKTPKMDLSAPKIRTELDSSDFSIRGYKPDVTAPDMNVDFHKGKIKGPNFKKHHVDVNAPDFDIDAPYSKMKLSGNMPEGGDLKFSYPKMNLNPPKLKEELIALIFMAWGLMLILVPIHRCMLTDFQSQEVKQRQPKHMVLMLPQETSEYQLIRNIVPQNLTCRTPIMT